MDGIIANIFSDISISVGYGTNAFTMQRGSFNYKQKIHWKRQLKVLDNKYVDPKTGDIYDFDLTVNEEDGSLSFRLLSDVDETKANRYWITFDVYEDEHFYGCGETFSEFDLKGQKVRIWTAEHQNAKRITKKIIRDRLTGKHPNSVKKFSNYESYYVQPTFVSSRKYFVHVNSSAYSEFDFRKKGKITLYLQDSPDIIVSCAPTFEKLSEKLSLTLGKQSKLPTWLYEGVVLASQEGVESIEKKIELAKDKDIPLVGFWSQDWCGCRRTGFGYQVMWNWEYDKELYPNLPQKNVEWRKQGIRFLGYINPFMAIEKNLYKYATEHGYCVKNKDGEDYLVTITTFPAAMIDFTNPAAYEWYKDIIKKNMIGIGMSGWMADFGEYLPTDCVLFDGSSAQKRHNEWPAIWAKLNYEAIKESDIPNKDEIFFFTRAGFTETIKYSPVMWNGDQHVDFSLDDGLPSVIPATLSLSMSGFGITHSDVGGYTTIMQMARNKELLLRWEEMNAFSPLMRFHEGNQPSRNVQFDIDNEALEHLSKFVKIHVLLGDYLKSCVMECEKNGTPIMRPIFYHYDEEWAYTEKTEYLLGRDLLVAPVIVEKAISRKVKLPKGKWIHLFSHVEYDGGEHIVEAPIGRPPVFIRANSEYIDCLMCISEK